MRVHLRFSLAASLLLSSLTFAFVAPVSNDKPVGGGGRRRGGGEIAPNVLVVPATAKDVPVYIAGVGSAKALNSVTVRAQVSGILTKISFMFLSVVMV